MDTQYLDFLAGIREERERWIKLLEFGCGDNSCVFHKPEVGTNGGCQCLKALNFDQRRAVLRALRKIRGK